jgi:hypothetical protein
MNGQQVTSWDLEPTQQNITHLQQVVKDLEIVHDPRTTNTQRLQSQSVRFPSNKKSYKLLMVQRLDQVRDDVSSWKLAIALASQRNSFPDPVRHFGISVLESEIKYFWGSYSDSEILSIRHGLIQLCGEVRYIPLFLPKINVFFFLLVGRNQLSTNLFGFQTRVTFRRNTQKNLVIFLG